MDAKRKAGVMILLPESGIQAKKLKRRKHSKIIFQSQHQPGTKARQGHCKKRKLQNNIPDKHTCKNSQRNTRKPNQQHFKRIIRHDKNLSLKCKDGSACANE